MPVARALESPVLLIVATDVLELAQVPFAVVLENCTLEPIQVLLKPVMAATVGEAVIVTTELTLLVQLLEFTAV